MKRWMVIGSVAFVAVVLLMTLVLVLMNRGGSDEPAKVSEVAEGWKTIEHSTYGISVQVPLEWSIDVYDDGKGYVSGFFNGETTAIYFTVSGQPNIENLNQDDLLGAANTNLSAEKVSQGGLRGISYLGKVDSHGDYDSGNQEAEVIFDSYLGGRSLIVGNSIVEVECSLIGGDYASYISLCDEALKSVKGI